MFCLLTEFKRSTEEKCNFCNKNFKSLGRHLWRCPAKIHSKPLQVTRIHGSDINRNNIHMEQSTRSLANTNQSVDVTDTEGIITEYDKEMPTDKGNDGNYIECHCGKLYKGNFVKLTTYLN